MKNILLKKKVENCNEYSEVDIDDCIDFKTFKLFFFNWRNNINSELQSKEIKRYFSVN